MIKDFSWLRIGDEGFTNRVWSTKAADSLQVARKGIEPGAESKITPEDGCRNLAVFLVSAWPCR